MNNFDRYQAGINVFGGFYLGDLFTHPEPWVLNIVGTIFFLWMIIGAIFLKLLEGDQ